MYVFFWNKHCCEQVMSRQKKKDSEVATKMERHLI